MFAPMSLIFFFAETWIEITILIKIQFLKCFILFLEWLNPEYYRFSLSANENAVFDVTPLSGIYNDFIMGVMASQITSFTIVYSTVYSGADQRKHQSSASLAFVLGIHPWPVNCPHKWPVMRKMYPFDDIIMLSYQASTAKKPLLKPDKIRYKALCPSSQQTLHQKS